MPIRDCLVALVNQVVGLGPSESSGGIIISFVTGLLQVNESLRYLDHREGSSLLGLLDLVPEPNVDPAVIGRGVYGITDSPANFCTF